MSISLSAIGAGPLYKEWGFTVNPVSVVSQSLLDPQAIVEHPLILYAPLVG